MVLNYFPGSPPIITDNTGILNMTPTVTITGAGLTLNMSIAWDDNGPGPVFPPIGSQRINYGSVANQVSYLPISTPGNWQVKVALPYTAQPAFIGTQKIDVLELWTADGSTRCKGPSSSATADTILANGNNEWKTNPINATQNGQLPNLPSYLVKVWSKDPVTGAPISNLSQFVVNQNENSGTFVTGTAGPWDVTYELFEGSLAVQAPQTTVGYTAKVWSKSIDNPFQAEGSYSVRLTVKRSAEATGEVWVVPITVVQSNPTGNPTVTITKAADGSTVQPGATVLTTDALSFNVTDGKASYVYPFRFNSELQGNVITDSVGVASKIFMVSTAGSYNVSILDPATSATYGQSIVVNNPPDDGHQCPAGYQWDSVSQSCKLINTGGGGTSFLEQIAAFLSNPAILVGGVALAAVAITRGGRTWQTRNCCRASSLRPASI